MIYILDTFQRFRESFLLTFSCKQSESSQAFSLFLHQLPPILTVMFVFHQKWVKVSIGIFHVYVKTASVITLSLCNYQFSGLTCKLLRFKYLKSFARPLNGRSEFESTNKSQRESISPDCDL